MKHPVLGNRVSLLVWWLVWLFLTLGQLLLYYFAYGSYTPIAIADGIISYIAYSGIGLSLWYPFRYLNAATNNAARIITNLVISGTVAIALWLLITRYGIALALPGIAYFKEYWEATFPYRTGTGIFIYCLLVLAYYLFISLHNIAEKNAKEARLESLVKETELKMLRSQINPHFLFNSLNSISSLTITDPDRAREMVINLSEFMRYSLSKKDEQPVTLKSELENLRLYLEIEKVRFGDKLSTEEYIDAACLETKMPVMLLQPLYENAIKHGVYESTECVRIATYAKMTGDIVEITVSNNYDDTAPPKKGTGTGLFNVKRRLELFYGNRASLKTSIENGVFTVSIYIPSDI
jgi:signal transduction histidine kinase